MAMRWLVDFEDDLASGKITADQFAKGAYKRVLSYLAVSAFESGFNDERMAAYSLAKSVWPEVA